MGFTDLACCLYVGVFKHGYLYGMKRPRSASSCSIQEHGDQGRATTQTHAMQQMQQSHSREKGGGGRGGELGQAPPAGGGRWPAAQGLPHAAYPGALPAALPSAPTCTGSQPGSSPAPKGNRCCAGTVAEEAAESVGACMSPLSLIVITVLLGCTRYWLTYSFVQDANCGAQLAGCPSADRTDLTVMLSCSRGIGSPQLL